MIIRYYIKCSTCNHPHTLRIQVGHEPYQEHSFNCLECSEGITIGMDCDASNATTSIRTIDNCELGTIEGDIINLSSEFPIAPGDIHRDMAFPSILYTDSLRRKQEELGVKAPSFESFEKYKEHVLNSKGPNDLWPILKKGWSLTLKNLIELANAKLEEYEHPGFDDPKQLNYVLFDFSCHMLSPGKLSLFENAAELTGNIKRSNPAEYQRFIEYYKDRIKEDNLHRYFEVFSEFFKCYNDFSQTLHFLQHDIEVPDDLIASSSSFNKTKLFYGNAFESLTSNITVLACLNNIHNGRKFDEFETMNLDKYLTINKANRANPFKDTEAYNDLCTCLDSTLRNASHHGAMKIDQKGRIIHYRSGGTGSNRSITYKEYIDRCNIIMLSCCALLSMELAISF